jgi:type IV secretory pathway VirB9-like protein
MKQVLTFPVLVLLALAGCDSPKVPLIDARVPTNPSLTRACLPMGLNEYNAAQLGTSVFCTPGGEYIMELTISDRNAWTVRTHESRAVFAPVVDEPNSTIVVVTTPKNRYQFNLVR